MLISLKPEGHGAIPAWASPGFVRIGRCGVGYDNVDLAACTEHGIAVFITPGGVVRPVAESIVLLRAGAFAQSSVAKIGWCARDDGRRARAAWGGSRAQRVVGTIGLGNIASEAIRLLAGS